MIQIDAVYSLGQTPITQHFLVHLCTEKTKSILHSIGSEGYTQILEGYTHESRSRNLFIICYLVRLEVKVIPRDYVDSAVFT